jgi:hypothetical protein
MRCDSQFPSRVDLGVQGFLKVLARHMLVGIVALMLWFTATPACASVSFTETPTPVGPLITYFGLTDSQGIPMPTAAVDDQGDPVCLPSSAFHFNIVVEAEGTVLIRGRVS